MKVYIVYQIYTDWDDEPQEDLDKIFKNEVDAYNYAEADKMFEELGYELHKDYITDIGCFYRKKESHYIYNEYPKIIFHYKPKKITIQNEFLNMQELQAINKKCKELGWI